MRLDKFLKETGFGSRKEVKSIIKQKRIFVNASLVTDESKQIDEEHDTVCVDGVIVKYVRYVYIMLNKPQGVVSATKDNLHKTVIDLIDEYKYLNLFPVGRLDIDTEGLLLITNDGEISHNLLSPKKHVNKTYYLETDMPLSIADMKQLENGVIIDDELTLPAHIEEGPNKNSYYLTIHEGRFHQVKKMIMKVSKNVTYLKRISFGPLQLDNELPLGKYRILDNVEIQLLKNINKG